MSSMTLRNLRQSSLCFERAPLARWHFRRCASSKTPNQVFGDAASAEFLAAAASETSIPQLNGLPEVSLSFISAPFALNSLQIIVTGLSLIVNHADSIVCPE